MPANHHESQGVGDNVVTAPSASSSSPLEFCCLRPSRHATSHKSDERCPLPPLLAIFSAPPKQWRAFATELIYR